MGCSQSHEMICQNFIDQIDYLIDARMRIVRANKRQLAKLKHESMDKHMEWSDRDKCMQIRRIEIYEGSNNILNLDIFKLEKMRSESERMKLNVEDSIMFEKYQKSLPDILDAINNDHKVTVESEVLMANEACETVTFDVDADMLKKFMDIILPHAPNDLNATTTNKEELYSCI